MLIYTSLPREEELVARIGCITVETVVEWKKVAGAGAQLAPAIRTQRFRSGFDDSVNR